MAFNFRPTDKKQITDLKFQSAKEKDLLYLFDLMKNLFKSSNEYFTMDLSKPGHIKILRQFEKDIVLNDYKKQFKNLNISIGNGLPPNTSGPSTQQQELCTLKIFEAIFSSTTPKYKSFVALLPELQKIYPELNQKDSWYKSFELQFNKIKEKTKLPANRFKVYNRDGGFMDYITKLVAKFGISKKDSWNPADIWLLKDTTYEKSIQKQLNEAVSVGHINDVLKKAFKDQIIVGISLKKNDGRNLKYELVNIENGFKLPKVKILKYNINVEFDLRTKSFTNVTSSIDVDTGNNIAKLAIKSNQGGIGNTTYEFVERGAAAQLGKVPKDMLNLALKEYGFSMPVHTDFGSLTKIDINNWNKKISIIKKSKMFVIKGDIDAFVNNLKISYTKGKSKDNAIISQIMQFAYILSSLPQDKLTDLITNFYYMAQKKGKIFGPFGKLY